MKEGIKWWQNLVSYKVANSRDCITYVMSEQSFINYVRDRQNKQWL